MSDYVSLWDVLVDSPYRDTTQIWRVCNARSPEYLMVYLENHKDSALKQMHGFSKSG